MLELKLAACVLAPEAGTAFIVTCTGFNKGGVTKVAMKGWSWEEDEGEGYGRDEDV